MMMRQLRKVSGRTSCRICQYVSTDALYQFPQPYLFIDNEFSPAEAGRTLPVYSPRDGSIVAEIANATPSDVDRAVASAQRCFRALECGDSQHNWPGSTPAYRGAILRRMAVGLRERLEEFAWLETIDCGKPLAESRADMEACASFFDYYADLVTPNAGSSLRGGHLVPQDLDCPESAVSASLLREPIGVVGCITPWNFPLMQAVVKVAPALAAGCSVVLKPSPLASLTCILLGELARDADLPPGALNIVTGGPLNSNDVGPPGEVATGVALAEHRGLDKLSFTGSGATGKELLQVGAGLLRPTGLELGGKGAMIIFDDADISSAVDWAMIGIFLCSGQVCSATSRILVDESIASKFTAQLVSAVKKKLVVGDPLDTDTNMGPCVSVEQCKKIEASVSLAASDDRCDALLEGGKQILASSAHPKGFFIPPQIFRVRRCSVRGWPDIWWDEIFGPVLAISTFRAGDMDDAVALANDSPYGLAHAVFTCDEARGDAVANRLRTGVVWKNCNQLLYPTTPFGGCKQSGFGREYGELGLEEFCHHKTVIQARAGYSWGWYQ